MYSSCLGVCEEHRKDVDSSMNELVYVLDFYEFERHDNETFLEGRI